MSGVHISYTRYTETCCVVLHCPTCDRLRRFSAQFQEWYGWTKVCAGCGDMWSDGEMHERPFCPGWRKQNREYARKVLASIGVQA